MKNVLNLADFTYAQFKETVENHKELRLVDAEAKIDMSVVITPSNAIKDFSPSPSLYFTGRPEDGVVISVGDECCTLTLEADSRSLAYAAYRDEVKNIEALEFYDKSMPAVLRDFVSNSPTRRSIRVDIAEIERNNPHKGENVGVQVPDGAVKHPPKPSGIGPDNRGQLIIMHILKEKGSNVMDHELEWQIDDMCASLNFLAEYTALGFYREGKCGYEGGSNADRSLANFRTWAKANNHLAGVDIFMLVRWGGWDSNILGIAYVDVYDVNQYYNDWAFGLSATSCLYSKTFAHEIGHIMGAEHVDDVKDLMYYSNHISRTNQHRNQRNRDKIWTRGYFRR